MSNHLKTIVKAHKKEIARSKDIRLRKHLSADALFAAMKTGFAKNEDHRPGVCNARFDYWFTYLCEDNEHQYYSHLNDTIKFKYHLLEELNSAKSIKDILWDDVPLNS